MRRFIYSSLSALLLSASILSPALASAPKIELSASGSMVFDFTAPFISSSGLLNDSHIIQVMVIGMSLEDLTISIPPQMGKFSRVQVTDGTGKAVAAKITTNKKQVAIAFDQPVNPGQLLHINIVGIQTDQEEGSILLYGLTGHRAGIRDEIPIGTARIQVPGRG